MMMMDGHTLFRDKIFLLQRMSKKEYDMIVDMKHDRWPEDNWGLTCVVGTMYTGQNMSAGVAGEIMSSVAVASYKIMGVRQFPKETAKNT